MREVVAGMDIEEAGTGVVMEEAVTGTDIDGVWGVDIEGSTDIEDREETSNDGDFTRSNLSMYNTCSKMAAVYTFTIFIVRICLA